MKSDAKPKKEKNLTQEAFARFLNWLNPDPDQAGEKYEAIRRRLIKIFACRGCDCSEHLADETINRVIDKIPEISESYEGDRALYFYGVARYVHKEYTRKKPPPQPPPQDDASSATEEEYECLEQCMGNLPKRSRELFLQYNEEEKGAKIKHRKRLARELNIPLNALRIRIYRIRMNLQVCVLQCLQQRASA
jgi:DNA-directed RNA polymerase specialized sigma24 family protein